MDATETTKTRKLLLINNKITSYDILVQCANNDTIVYTYDDTTPAKTIVAGLLSHEGVYANTFDNIGWVFHGFQGNKLHLAGDMDLLLDDLEKGNIETVCTSLLKPLQHLFPKTNDSPRLDLLACCLAQNQSIFSQISGIILNTTNITIAASSDLTGNITGSNWML